MMGAAARITPLDAMIQRVHAASGRARAVLSSRRRKDRDLYALLADLLRLAEDVEAQGLTDDLRTAYARELRTDDGDQRSRRYVETTTTACTLVARYVLDRQSQDQTMRAATHRYGKALSRAWDMGIGSADLAAYLAENGGVWALAASDKTGAVKGIRFTTAAELPRTPGARFTLRLRVAKGGVYAVEAVEA